MTTKRNVGRLQHLYDSGKVTQVEGVVGLGGCGEQLGHRLAVHVQGGCNDAWAQFPATVRKAASSVWSGKWSPVSHLSPEPGAGQHRLSTGLCWFAEKWWSLPTSRLLFEAPCSMESHEHSTCAQAALH